MPHAAPTFRALNTGHIPSMAHGASLRPDQYLAFLEREEHEEALNASIAQACKHASMDHSPRNARIPGTGIRSRTPSLA